VNCASDTLSLAAFREQSEREFARVGAPGPHHEEWGYTQASLFLEPGASASEDAVAALVAQHSLPEAWQVLVFVGGIFRGELSRRAPSDSGVEVASLSAACAADPSLRPGRLDPADRAFFLANRARWTDGLFLKVPSDIALPGPVQILDIGSGNSWLRHLVLAGRGAKGSVFEVRVGPDGTSTASLSVLEAKLEEGADLLHANLQAGGDKLRSWTGLVASLGAGARLASRQFQVAGDLARAESFVDLSGPLASVELSGLSAVSGERRADVLTVVRHAVPETSSEQLFQALAGGRSVASFLGVVQVESGAQKTAARQSSRNLLLSREASINSRPQLEIWADDVKCSHGSATGRLDEKALFFLRSRGLSEAGAKMILVRAFAGELVGKLPEGALRERVESLLEVVL
jgi:Fe-S cluster assembly protein SufD